MSNTWSPREKWRLNESLKPRVADERDRATKLGIAGGRWRRLMECVNRMKQPENPKYATQPISDEASPVKIAVLNLNGPK